jgi:hypothetical protein
MVNKRVVKELREDCECVGSKYCPLEILIKSMGERFLEQHKCVEKYKYELGVRLKKEIDWDEAYTSWVNSGYAKQFAKVYTDKKTFRELYKETMDKDFIGIY